MSISVNNSNPASVFLSTCAMLILVMIKSEPYQAHIFQYTYCENFRIHMRVIMCHFEHANHDTHLEFLF